MSDETRRTRLLKFRPRRAEIVPGNTVEPHADRDAELSALLAEWETPAPSPFAEGKMLAAYRDATARTSLWRKLLTANVRLPLPLAACLVLALVASLLAHFAHRPSDIGDGVNNGAAESRAVAPAVVQYVEVPVPTERVVTRVVYADRKSTPARRAPNRSTQVENAQTGDAASYFTPVDMAEFKPADEVKIRVVKKGER